MMQNRRIFAPVSDAFWRDCFPCSNRLPHLILLLYVQIFLAHSVKEHSKYGRKLQSPSPIDTFYVPLPEGQLLADTFDPINPGNVPNDQFVNTLISISVEADGTIIWYDHWYVWAHASLTL